MTDQTCDTRCECDTCCDCTSAEDCRGECTDCKRTPSK